MSRFPAVMIVVGALGWSTPPQDVNDDAALARQRMSQLIVALYEYAYDNGAPPEQPADLFPDYVFDPLTFYHPGDLDPPPVTIDNSAPNAPNSAQISFEFLYLDPDAVPFDVVLLQDNSVVNNAGAFINMMPGEETDPPLATPSPTATALARMHLQHIGAALAMYVNDNHAMLPDDLIQLIDEGHLGNPRTFWNPGDRNNPVPSKITTSELDADNSTQMSFEFLAAGMQWSHLQPGDAMLRDLTDANNGGAGFFELQADGQVVLLLSDPCDADLNGDGAVDAFDLASLLGQWGPAQAQPADLNLDEVVDQSDVLTLIHSWGLCGE